MNSKSLVTSILSNADIKIVQDASLHQIRPWDIVVHNEKFYNRVRHQGSLGLGESYIAKWWDCKDLDKFFFNLLSTNLNNKFLTNAPLLKIKQNLLNLQSKMGSFQSSQPNNILYEMMLDKRMVYSCAYWKNAEALDDAQEAKLELICKKLHLRPGMEVLEIGCGWGGFARYASERYGVKVTCLTLSEDQIELGQQMCRNCGGYVNLKLMDYKDIKKNTYFYDRVVSIEMFESVGVKNYRKYMEIVSSCLKMDGIFLLQTAGNNRSVTTGEAFLDKYIFPNNMIPSLQQIAKSMEGLLMVEDLHNIGLHYDKTLMAWFENFSANWELIKQSNPKYDEKFYRMWTYYLRYCAGSFRARHSQVWQILITKLKTGVEIKTLDIQRVK